MSGCILECGCMYTTYAENTIRYNLKMPQPIKLKFHTWYVWIIVNVFLHGIFYFFKKVCSHFGAYIFLTIWFKSCTQMEYDHSVIPIKFGANRSSC